PIRHDAHPDVVPCPAVQRQRPPAELFQIVPVRANCQNVHQSVSFVGWVNKGRFLRQATIQPPRSSTVTMRVIPETSLPIWIEVGLKSSAMSYWPTGSGIASRPRSARTTVSACPPVLAFQPGW